MILIVDNSEDTRELIKKVLSREGFMPAIAANGEEALDLIKKSNLSTTLIFLDSKIDFMNGQDFLNALEICCAEKPIKVVVMSGSDRTLESDLIIDSMPKPLDLDRIKYYAAQFGTKGIQESLYP